LFIKSIKISNFRNYDNFSYNFSSEGTILTGPNGIGKSNLLEAVSYFAYGKSILSNKDIELIQNNENNQLLNYFSISSSFVSNNTEIDLFVKNDTSKRKIIKVHDKQIKKISALYKYIQVIYSSPNDIFNIFSTPFKRRQFLDMSIAKIYPSYIESLNNYKNILHQRNVLLKTNFDQKEKNAWDKRFIDEAFTIIEYRQKFISSFKLFFSQAYNEMINENEKVSLLLKLNFFKDDFKEVMQKELFNIQKKEIKYQTTLIGPHLDDFIININNKNASIYGSQGQKRSIVIALKLGMSSFIHQSLKIYPILIFDDTLAELDKERTLKLLNHLSQKHQIFIASPTLDKYSSVNLPILNLEKRLKNGKD